ncbi:ABC transporter substrate-binding protein [Paramicrobacterium chengjingii]|uniref:ABC transporter substrate-binding protein n=1 Tax=Paramicrobacterium chengjingii TaxID=2769067 RepID=UPI00141EE072|nr:ABC transporter substrate-binding protein [Microbacterium chengjingii]
MRRKVLTVAAALATGAIMLSGCSASSGSGSDESLTFVCSPQEDWCQLVASAFTEETGIEANYVRLSGGEAVARLSASGDTPEFDAWFGAGADGHIAAHEAGLIEHFVPDGAAAIPDEYKDPEGYWTGIYVGALSFCSNTDVLDKLGIDPPTSWQDLLDPKLKSNIAMAHPATSGTAYQAVWSQVILNDGDQDAAIDYFKQMHSNVLQYSKSGSAPGQMAGRGEVGVGVIFAQDCQKFVNEGFTQLVATYPEEGADYEVGAVSLIKNAKHPEAAKKFIEWSLTAEAQDLAATVGTYSIPTNPDATITDDMVDPTTLNLLDADISEMGKARNELTARFDAEVAPAPKS